MKGDQMGIRPAYPTPRELPLSNRTRFSSLSLCQRKDRLATLSYTPFGPPYEDLMRASEPAHLRRSERLLFFLLAVLIWPFIAIGVGSGWGFLVWMYYKFTGPSGPVWGAVWDRLRPSISTRRPNWPA